MKLIHISDLHLGKRVGGAPMLEEQEHVLGQILDIIGEERPAGVLIAGDIYDKAVPSAEAVSLFDDFLYRLSSLGAEVFVISGNHDSPERIAFGARLMDKSGIHLSPVYSGTAAPFTLSDEYGQADIFMLPFVKPAHVRRFFPGAEISSFNDALSAAVGALPLDPARRSVLVTHQLVTGARACESEDISVGGAENVDAAVFAQFDYVALGHMHSPQYVGRETLRYCGSPLKYSFSEAKHEKSVTVVELREKGRASVRERPLIPLRDMREVRGSYMEVASREFSTGFPADAYLHVTLTDEEDIPYAIGKLRALYPNILKLDYDNRRTRAGGISGAAENVEQRAPLELFEEFYEKQNGGPMSAAQQALAAQLIETIWEGAK